MKKKIYHLIYVVIAVLLVTSCENDMPLKQNENFERLVMNAFIDADSTNNVMYLNLTGVDSTKMITDAHIEVKVNGNLKETETASSKNIYPVKTQFHPGDVVRIDAYTDDNKYHAWVEETVPHPVAGIDAVDTSHVYKRYYYDVSEYGGEVRTSRVWRDKISFKDNGGGTNYYRLVFERFIKKETYLTYLYEWPDTYKTDTTLEHIPYFGTDYICYEDPIMMDGHTYSPDEGDFNDYLPVLESTENSNGVFDDNRFKGKSCTLTVYDDLTDYPLYKRSTNDLGAEETVKCAIDMVFSLQSITESEYYYYKALNQYESTDYSDNEDLTGPMKFPTNVHGGAGMVGFSSSASKSIPLQGKYD